MYVLGKAAGFLLKMLDINQGFIICTELRFGSNIYYVFRWYFQYCDI